MEYEQILREQRDDVVVLTLNRPDKLNAWTPRMTAELTHAIAGADADPSVGAVVMTGAGRGFCAGADISAVFEAQLEGDASASVPQGDHDWVDLIRSTKPIVAAVNGPAIGMGLTMMIDEVAAPDAVLDVAIERAREYGENPTPQVRWIKQLLTQNANETDPRAVQMREVRRVAEAYSTPEHREAVAAFLEGRKPTFR